MRLVYAFPEPLPLPKARGIQTAWMVDALCAAGVEVCLAHVPAGAHPLQSLGRQDSHTKLELLPLSRNWPFPLQRWHSVSRFAGRLQGRFATHRPDAVFVRHLKLAYRLLRARPDLPLFYEAHEVFAATAPAAKRMALEAQEAYVLARAAGVVYISGAVRQALHQEYRVGGAEIVLHSGVDLPPVVPEKNWSNCGRHILYAGSFWGWKGVDDLVAAAAHLPGCRVTLLGGEAVELERLRAAVSPAGAEVVLLPRLPPEQVMGRMLQTCIAVLPNRSDGVSQFTSPLKLFEYMGAGCAVVAADLPSIREVLPAEHAAWFTPGDPRSLAAALRQLTEQPELARRHGEAARRLAQNCTWQARAEALVEFMNNVVSGYRRDRPAAAYLP